MREALNAGLTSLPGSSFFLRKPAKLTPLHAEYPPPLQPEQLGGVYFQRVQEDARKQSILSGFSPQLHYQQPQQTGYQQPQQTGYQMAQQTGFQPQQQQQQGYGGQGFAGQGGYFGGGGGGGY